MTERPKPGYHEAELAHEQRIGQTLQTIELQGKSIADNLRQRPYDLKDTLTIASDTNPEANIEASDRRYALPKNHQFMPSPFARQPIIEHTYFDGLLGRLIQSKEGLRGSLIGDLFDRGGFPQLKKTHRFQELDRQAQVDRDSVGYREEAVTTSHPGLSIVFARIPIERRLVGSNYGLTGEFRRVVALRFSKEFQGLGR